MLTSEHNSRYLTERPNFKNGRSWLLENEIIKREDIFNYLSKEVSDMRWLAEYVLSVWHNHWNKKEYDEYCIRIAIKNIIFNNRKLFSKICSIGTINMMHKTYIEVEEFIESSKILKDVNKVKNIKNNGTKKPRKKGKHLYAAEARFFAENKISLKIKYEEKGGSVIESIINIYYSASHEYISCFCRYYDNVRLFNIKRIIDWEALSDTFEKDEVIKNKCLEALLSM